MQEQLSRSGIFLSCLTVIGARMLEYIFFDDKLQHQFCDYLRDKQIGFSLADDSMGQLVKVQLPDDDSRSEQLDEVYDDLMEQQEVMLQQEDADSTQTVTAITVHLQDGTTVYANVEADLMNRLLAVISPEEISDLVDAIASAIENRDTLPLCKR